MKTALMLGLALALSGCVTDKEIPMPDEPIGEDQKAIEALLESAKAHALEAQRRTDEILAVGREAESVADEVVRLLPDRLTALRDEWRADPATKDKTRADWEAAAFQTMLGIHVDLAHDETRSPEFRKAAEMLAAGFEKVAKRRLAARDK